MARKSSNLVVLAAWVLSFCLVIQPLPAPAQVLYGSIAGTLTDPSGAALPNTHVTVTNPLTGLKREVDGSALGQYTVPNLPDGTYAIVITASGFREFKQTGVVVHAGLITRADATLRVGPTAEQVTVEAPATVLKTENTDVSTELGTVAVENLPGPPVACSRSRWRLWLYWRGGGHTGAGYCDPRERVGSIVELYSY